MTTSREGCPQLPANLGLRTGSSFFFFGDKDPGYRWSQESLWQTTPYRINELFLFI